MGAPPRVVMEIAGHSAIDVTMNVYGHVDLDSRRVALDRLADLFETTSEPSTEPPTLGNPAQQMESSDEHTRQHLQ